MNTIKTILGIDPGTTVMGYGLIQVIKNNCSVLQLGVIELHKFNNHFEKLQKIFERTLHLLDEYKVSELAIESQFFGKNVQSMLKLGRAQGVVIAAALYRNVRVFEYSPKKIKVAITGNGNASKEQVATMLQHILKTDFNEKYLDATDALASALCHHFQNKSIVEVKSYKSWKDFITQNPNRIK